MSANIKASVDGTQAIIGVGGVDQMTVSNAGVVTANSFVGAISAGNISSSTAIATGSTTARTLANRFADVVNVKDFGAVGDGIADDTAAIQTAINFIVSTGNPSRLDFNGGTYKLNAGLTINCGYVSCYGNRAVLDFSSVGDIPCITFIGGNPYFGNPYNQSDFTFESFKIKGPSKTSATALYLNQNDVGSAMGPSHTVFKDLNITNFKYGIRGGSHSYLSLFNHIDIWQCTNALYFPNIDLNGNPLVDYGANFTFVNGTLYSNTNNFSVVNNTQTGFTFLGTIFGEIDSASGTNVYIGNGSLGCSFTGCHFESDGKHIFVGTNANATISGTTFLSKTTNQDKLIESDGYLSISGGVIAAPALNTNVIYGSASSRVYITNLQKVTSSVSFYSLNGRFYKSDLDDNATETNSPIQTQNISYSFKATNRSGFVSAASGIATLMLSLDFTAANRMYFIAIQSPQGDANYSGFAIIATDSTSARIVFNGSGSFANITISGLDVYITQSSGGSKSFNYSFMALN
jgi:hypothetical protein